MHNGRIHLAVFCVVVSDHRSGGVFNSNINDGTIFGWIFVNWRYNCDSSKVSGNTGREQGLKINLQCSQHVNR